MEYLRYFPVALSAALIAFLLYVIFGKKKLPSKMPKHRIAIRVIDGAGEFYDRTTGKKFVPRGNNYIRLTEKTVNGQKIVEHATFNPGAYDHVRTEKALAQMHQNGYNVVRVFLNNAAMGAPTGGLSQLYLANVADFLKLAKQYEIYPILTQDWIPGGKYGDELNKECCSSFDSNNLLFLSQSGMNAFKMFYTDFLSALFKINAPTDVIFSYELANEMFYSNDLPPLSLQSGIVTAANYKQYDMSTQAGKDKLIAETMPYWIAGVRGAIQKQDPTALVSVGFMRVNQPKPGDKDQRLSVAYPAIWNSTADFIDLHTYRLPDNPNNAEPFLELLVNEFGMAGMQEKPIIMGEFSVGKIIPTEKQAALLLASWQVASCKFGFDGWLLWTWDLNEVQNDYWSALDGTGAVNSTLSPVTRPDPCSWE